MLIYYVGTRNTAAFHIAHGCGCTVNVAHDTGLGTHDVAYGKDFAGIGIIDEAAYIIISRIGDHFLGSANLHHAAVTQNAYVRAQAEGFVNIMGDKYNGFACAFLDAQQLKLQVVAHQGVQGRKGLVHQKNIGIVG